RVVIGEALGFTAHFVVLEGLAERRETGGSQLKRAAAAERVRLVGDASAVNGLPVHAVALVVVDLGDGSVDGNLVEVRTAEARNLRVVVRVNAAGQQRVVREVDTGNDVRGAERHLLGLGEE